MLRSIGSCLVYPLLYPLCFCRVRFSLVLVSSSLFFTSISYVFPPSCPDSSFMCPPAVTATPLNLVVALFRVLSPLAIVTLTGTACPCDLSQSSSCTLSAPESTTQLLAAWSLCVVSVILYSHQFKRTRGDSDRHSS